MNYRDFRITIDNERAIFKVPDSEDEIQWPLRDRERESRWRAVEMFSRWVELSDGSKPGVIGPAVGRDMLELLGSFLYEILFGKEIEGEFAAALREAQEQPDTKLRLVLHFKPSADKLATRPWEYLYRPNNEQTGRGFFLAADAGLVLSRQVPLKIPFPSAEPGPLRVLAVVSQPRNETKIQAMAKEVIEEMQKLESVQVDRLDQPSKASFEEKMRRRPHIVHFFGHGRYNESEQKGELAFVNPGERTPITEEEERAIGSAQWIADDAIADYCKEFQPRLVFLQACEGAATDSYRTFAGVGLKLVQAAVPAVVAMKYQIIIRDARVFACAFYQSLAAGLPIDAAVQIGRKKLGHSVDPRNNFNDRAFGTPIVYLQSKSVRSDYRIVIPVDQPASMGTDPAPPTAPSEDKVPCAYRPACTGEVFRKGKRCSKCNRPYVICARCGQAILPESATCDYCGKEQAAASARQAAPSDNAPRASNAPAMEKKDSLEAHPATTPFEQVPRTPTDPRMWKRDD